MKLSNPFTSGIPASLFILQARVSAHGTTTFPPSRSWICSGGASPNLGVAWNGGNAPNICKPDAHTSSSTYNINNVITDWQSVGIGAAEGRRDNNQAALDAMGDGDFRAPHVNVMGGIDAKICSGNMEKFDALNDPSFTQDKGGYPTNFPIQEYPTTLSTGNHKFSYAASAAHRTTPTGYVDVYITKSGINLNKELTWEDLEIRPICSYTPATFPTGMQQSGVNSKNEDEFDCEIPSDKNGQHVIYTVWQRDDSGEAFYACSDVIIGEVDPNGQTDAETAEPETAEPETPEPETPEPETVDPTKTVCEQCNNQHCRRCHPTDPNKYLECANSVNYEMSCSPGLYWDQANQYCNWPDQVASDACGGSEADSNDEETENETEVPADDESEPDTVIGRVIIHLRNPWYTPGIQGPWMIVGSSPFILKNCFIGVSGVPTSKNC